MLWFYKHWTIYLSKQLYFYEYLNDGEFYYKYTFCKLFVIIIYYFNNYNNSKILPYCSFQTWSIIYHSWLTFVLLLWANILWMIPNQRKAMMRSSPFIVCYAELLLIAQYIYGMNLKNDELPSKVEVSESLHSYL